MTFPNTRDVFRRYLLGKVTEEEAREIEEAITFDYNLRQELETAEEELIADYVVGNLREEDRVKFEAEFLSSEERVARLKFARAWVEKGGSICPDLSSPLHRYALGDFITPDEEIEVEEKLLLDKHCQEQLEGVQDELLIAYFNGRLPRYEKGLFEVNYLVSDRMVGKLRFAHIMREYVKRAEVVAPATTEKAAADRRKLALQWLFKPIGVSLDGRHITRPAWQPLTAALIAILSIFIWTLFFHQSALDQGLLALNAAYAEGRPVEARISGFAYAVYPAERGGDSTGYKQDVRDEAARAINSAIAGKEHKSAREYQALGQLYLTDRNFNKAADYFNLALRQKDRNAKLYNDLAVTLMAGEKAKKPGESTGENYDQASEYLKRAIALDPSLPEPRFNLGLCLEYQMLFRQAADYWKQYLEIDSSSQWAEEARTRLRGIEDLIKKTAENQERLRQEFREAALRGDGERAWQSFRNSRASFGSFVLNGVIDDYLSAKVTGRTTDADTALQILLFIGDVERARTGDRFTYDMANFYRVAGLRQLQKASEARALFKSAAESYGKSLLDEAVSKCRQAQAIFSQIGNAAEALLVQHLLGHCYRLQGSAKLGLSALTEGLQDCETKNYLWLLATYHNALRNAHVYLTEYSKAIEHNRELIANARRVENDLGVRLGLQGMAEINMYLGRYRESLQAAHEGLALAARLRATPNNFIAFYILASKSYMGLGKLAAALDYQQEGLKLSSEVNDPAQTSRHYANLGLALNKLGRHNEAVESIRKAAEVGRSVRDEKKSREMIAFSNLYLGQVYRDVGRYEDSAMAYQEAGQFYSENEIDNTVLLFETAKGKLLTAIQGGDEATAAKELNQVINFYEQHRVNIEDESSRNSFFDREQGIYDIAVNFAYSQQQNERQAFDYSELSRARSLLDTVSLPERKLPEGPLPDVRLPASIKPLGLDQIQARMPDRTYLLQYAMLDNKLIIWVISKNDLKSHSVEISQESLGGKVTAYLESLEAEWKHRKIDPRPQAVELYKILIEPIERWLDKDFEICIIPDKVLYRLPFAALMSPATRKYLIEERTLTVSPSANMFLVSTDLAGRKAGVKTERLLAVGNPDVDRKKFPNLIDLPNAASQAWEVAGFYDAKLIVLNGEAKEAYIRRQVEQSDVVDFAMHYIADERTPLLSILPLAEEKAPASRAQDGMLYAHELYGMNLSRLRLAILSGCQTGIERFYKGEGAISLARAFQGAGVPLVVASLWKVQDYQAKKLMVAFHKYRKQDGLSTAQALRRAQVDQIRSVDLQGHSPYHWAAYVVVGGRAGF